MIYFISYLREEGVSNYKFQKKIKFEINIKSFCTEDIFYKNKGDKLKI